MALMNGKQYKESIRKMKPTFYMFGEKLENPYDHPIIQASQNAYALTYDMAFVPEYKEMMTAKSHLTGNTINRFTQIYQSVDDMINKVRMIRMLSQKAGTCVQRCPTMDVGNVLFNVTYEMDKKLGTEYHKRYEKFYKDVQEKDLSVGVAMTDAKGDRTLKPHEQSDPDLFLHVVEERPDGIVVKGAKTNQTGSINHHFTFVASTQAMGSEDKDYSLAFAVKADDPGIIHIMGRQPGDTRRLESCKIDQGNPEYGCYETLMVFNNVFIPWERVFLYKEHEYAGKIPNLFGFNHRQTYGGCKAGLSDVLIGAVKLMAEYNGLGNSPIIKDKLADMVRLSETVYSCGLATAVEGSKTEAGTYFINPLLANVTKINVAALPFEMSRLAVDITGGIAGTMVSEEELKSPEIGKYIEKYLLGVPNVPAEHKMRIVTLIQNLLFGSNSVEYVVESVHGAGSPQAQKMSLMRLVDFDAKKKMATDIAGITK
jgi:4-hydroxybutyryl-CoA dehydratase / vinylacetyl-CoA-Delta-isomerase